MSNLENKIDEEVEELVVTEEHLTTEEQNELNSIQKVSFVKNTEKIHETEKPKPFSIWSLFGINTEYIAGALGGIKTRQAAPFDIQRMIGLEKVITINNISGKNAYVILTPAPIKTIESVGTGVMDTSFNVTFEEKGEYHSQKMSILNNTSSEYDLDNNKFFLTLFLHIDGKWKKTWENRRFNGRKYNINILKKHVQSALDKDNIPNF